MATSIRRRIPHLIGASGLAATLALGAGTATATAAQQEASQAKAVPTAPCSKQNPCTGGNQTTGNHGGPAVGINGPGRNLNNQPNKLPPGIHSRPAIIGKKGPHLNTQGPACTPQTCVYQNGPGGSNVNPGPNLNNKQNNQGPACTPQTCSYGGPNVVPGRKKTNQQPQQAGPTGGNKNNPNSGLLTNLYQDKIFNCSQHNCGQQPQQAPACTPQTCAYNQPNVVPGRNKNDLKNNTQ
ncbi:hypothetical protein AB0M68_34535 [Streptomyces sp. NPDC051453]|uniref:hypothetical protein n=1 Tax=Streptomyces sp. NPDC051453 TaxID=3154941 RepID=UPI00343B56D0